VTSLLIPSAVALLAHKRLVDAVEALEKKVNGTGGFYDLRAGGQAPTVVNPVEQQVLALARRS